MIRHVIFLLLQVYQARLRSNGKLVAVKVQRPGVQAVISLDIYILRFLAGVARKVGKFNTDLQVRPDSYMLSSFPLLKTQSKSNGKGRENSPL